MHAEAHLRPAPEKRGCKVRWNGVSDFCAKIQRDWQHREPEKAHESSTEVEKVLFVPMLRVVREANSEREREGQTEGQDELVAPGVVHERPRQCCTANYRYKVTRTLYADGS